MEDITKVCLLCYADWNRMMCDDCMDLHKIRFNKERAEY